LHGIVLSWSALCTVASRVPERSVASPLEIKSVVQWQISPVLVARRISDVKAETLTDTSRTQFAHAFDLTLSGCGHQAPVLRPALLRAERIEHLRRAAKPIHAILLPNGERRPKGCPVTCSRKWRFRRSCSNWPAWARFTGSPHNTKGWDKPETLIRLLTLQADTGDRGPVC
jgi:hypothetical protein